MKIKNWNILDFVTIAYLGLLLICTLFSGFILGMWELETDISLSMANSNPIYFSGEFFGRDYLGRNVLALMIDGVKYSLSISISSALLATALGILIGGLGGFFGDNQLYIKRSMLLIVIIFICIAMHIFNVSINALDTGNLLGFLTSLVVLILCSFILYYVLDRVRFFNKQVRIPLDFLGMKSIELLFAIPTYFILLALSSVIEASLISLIFIIGITSWPKTALLIRNEMLKVREMDYIKSLKLSGLPWYRILIRHAVPNAISPVLVNFVFFAAGLLVVESTLSFVGIGLPGEIVSWGKILGGFKHNSANWWTAVFPGIIIFLTILSYHRMGKFLRKI